MKFLARAKGRYAMRLTHKTAVIAVAIGAIFVFGGATTANAAVATSTQGCPSGYVCMYPQNAGWNNGVPSVKWYNYGNYNLSGVVGTHLIFNNQTGGAVITFWKGYGGGGGCLATLVPGTASPNMTPVNSVSLSAYSRPGCS
jgi:hypothetical protein